MKIMSNSRSSLTTGLLILLLLTGLALTAGAQQMMMMKAGENFFIPELMAMIEGQEKDVVIANKLPGTNLPKEYQALDVKKGDIIMMINGKNITKVAEMEKIYNELTIGQEIKLGVKREGVPHLVSFKKADPKNMPGLVMRKVNVDEGGAVDSVAGSGQKIIKMTPGGDLYPLPEIGLIISAKDNAIKVEVVIPMGDKKPFTEALQEGDIIRSIQGKNVTNKDELKKIYDPIAIGESGQLAFERAGKLISTSFTKLQPPSKLYKE